MAYGAPRYEFLASGSAATSAGTVHNLFGLFGGMSSVNQDDVVHIQVSASVQEFLIGPNGTNTVVSNNLGYKIYPSLSTVELPPMRVGTASLLQANRHTSADASWNWVVWRRIELYQ